MVKCSCTSPNCKTKIYIDQGGVLNFTDKEGKITVMYLDANTIVQLIKELKQSLLELSNIDAG